MEQGNGDDITRESVVVGDRFRFSVQLLRQFLESTDQHSPVVELTEIRIDPDDDTLLVLVLSTVTNDAGGTYGAG